MSDPKEVQETQRPFDEHPLYHAAMRSLIGGDEAGAAEKLRRLIKLYPQEQALQDQLVRLELKASLATLEYIPDERSKPMPILRIVMLTLLAMTIGIVFIAAAAIAYDRFVQPISKNRQEQEYIDSLHEQGRLRLESGDWAGARQVYDDLLTRVPADPTAQAAMEQIRQEEVLDQRYVDALSAQQRGDWQTALTLFRQIEAEAPGYRDTQQYLKTLKKFESLESTWLEAQDLILAEDWPGAIALLIQIRTQNPDFRRADVETQLYQIYVQMANVQIAQANGNLDLLRQATGYLDQALALRPTDQNLITERRLAVEFVAGFEALAQEDWADAVAHWEAVHLVQRNYQGGLLEDYLRDAYPKAAQQLITQARGAIHQLRQAIAYLDQALAMQPENQEWVEERKLAAEYVAGAEAFADGEWDKAITHWGPIYVTRPEYQNGALESNLRIACTNGSTPDTTFCPP
jgi:outer membrane protein assembly factor BamD (BamD/ComL family)